jgi:hypothetical protein
VQAPAVTGARQTHAVWREGRALARIAKAKRRPPVGTTFSFALNEQASVSLTFTQRLPGRRVKGRCVAQGQKNRRARSCIRTVTAGTLRFAAHAGPNSVSFQGRVSTTRTLKPGRYTLVIAAAAGGGTSAPAKLSFTIVS